MSNSYPEYVALAVTRGIGIVLLSVDATILDNEVKGVVHQATVAALVTGAVTVDELLF